MDAPGGPRSLAGDVEDLPKDVEMHPRWVGFGWRFVEKFVEWIWSSKTRDGIWHDLNDDYIPSLELNSSAPEIGLFAPKWRDRLPTIHFSGAMSIFQGVGDFGKWDYFVNDCLEGTLLMKDILQLILGEAPNLCKLDPISMDLALIVLPWCCKV